MNSLPSGLTSPFAWRITPDVIEHSFTSVVGQQFSAKEFYTEIRDILVKQKIPGIEVTDFHLSEGGPLSDDRLYLKIKRERLVFDVCAAPFGVNYFFSYRFVELPAVITIQEIIALCFVFGVICWLAFHLIGFFISTVALFFLLVPSIWIMRNAVGYGLQDLDKALLATPAIGPLYDRYLRKDTYYRQDSRMMYRNLVAEVIKATVARYTAANGVKLLREFTYTPLLDLYKTIPVTTPSDEAV